MKNPFKSLFGYAYYKEGKGEEAPLPERGVALFFFIVATYPWKLIQLSLLTCLLCLPICTIPAAMSAMFRVLMKLSLQGYCLFFTEYFQEFRLSLFRLLPFGLLTGALAFGSVYFTYTSIVAGVEGGFGYALIALSALVFLLVYLLWCYAYPLFSIIDLSVGVNIKNAVQFVLTQPRTDLLLVAVPLGVLLLCVALLPWTLPLFPLLLFSFVGLMVCCMIKPLIVEHVIRPHAQQNGGAMDAPP